MPDTNTAFRRVKRGVGAVLPASLKRHLSTAYNRVEERRADTNFAPADIDFDADPERDVVLVVVDALRADRVGRDVNSLPEQTATGEAVTAAPWTFPSVTSLLSGRYPHEHGAMRQSDDATDATSDEFVIPPALDDDVPTLPKLLAAAEYDTFGAFGFHMPFLALRGQFERHRLFNNCSCDQLLSTYRDWVASRSVPTFAYLHLSDLHEPVDPPQEYWETYDVDAGIEDVTGWDYLTPDPSDEAARYREHRERLYDAAAAYVDDVLTEYVAEFERILDDPLVVITSDHGEAFWEFTEFDAEHFVDSRPAYCVGHGGTPYESIARVPVLSTDPELPRFDSHSSLVDLAPTILESLELPVPDGMTGRPPDSDHRDRPLLVEASRYGHEKKAAYGSDWKLVASVGDDERVGFELPAERVESIPDSVYSELEASLPSWPDKDGPRGENVNDTVQQRLENLGYK